MQEFERCPFGILGLETAIGLSLEQLVHTRRISLMRMWGVIGGEKEQGAVMSSGRGH